MLQINWLPIITIFFSACFISMALFFTRIPLQRQMKIQSAAYKGGRKKSTIDIHAGDEEKYDYGSYDEAVFNGNAAIGTVAKIPKDLSMVPASASNTHSFNKPSDSSRI
eukprot:UN13252